MGQSLSEQQETALVTSMYREVNGDRGLPDVSIDRSILGYSRLDSTARLQNHHSYLLSFAKDKSPEYLEKVGNSLKELTGIPNAVGIGAMVIAMVLELALVGVKQPPTDTSDLLRRVFAEEKASEVRDLMDEYIKRVEMSLKQGPGDRNMVADTVRLEGLLSAQLTRLKNSMLRDGHMNPRSLKQWANGAAFHCQMLIHRARLERGEGGRAMAALGIYRRDLTILQDKYKDYLNSILYLWHESSSHDCRNKQWNRRLWSRALRTKRENPAFGLIINTCCVLTNSDTGRSWGLPYETTTDVIGPSCKYSSGAFVDTVVTNHMAELNRYFTETENNVEVLVTQHGSFSLM